MVRFLRENWIWIVAPIVLVAVGVVVLSLMAGDEAWAPMGYAIF